MGAFVGRLAKGRTPGIRQERGHEGVCGRKWYAGGVGRYRGVDTSEHMNGGSGGIVTGI